MGAMKDGKLIEAAVNFALNQRIISNDTLAEISLMTSWVTSKKVILNNKNGRTLAEIPLEKVDQLVGKDEVPSIASLKSANPPTKEIKVRKGIPKPIYYLGLLVILWLPTLWIYDPNFESSNVPFISNSTGDENTDIDLESGWAKYYLFREAKGCKAKELSGVKNPTFSFVDEQEMTSHLFIPEEGNCKGDVNNVITAQSKNLKLWPTYSYNLTTGERLCSHDGQRGDLHGCNGRENGTWFYIDL